MSAAPHVTLATATGPIWLTLVVHVLGGTVALAAGFVAVVAAKGGNWHRRAGDVFVVSMLVMAVFGAVVGAFEMKMTAVGGVLSAYFVITGFTTVRPTAGDGRTQHVALMAVALLVALFELTVGLTALAQSRRAINGVPAAMIVFMGTIALLAAIGDARMIRAHGMKGSRRLARHLWRMCFALFIASGSFFLGQMKFVPTPVRILPLMFALGVGPFVILLYWMWRVRVRHTLSRTTRATGFEPVTFSSGG